MKSYSKSLLICTSILTISAALASCNPNLPPATTQPSASATPSAGTSASPSPIATPSSVSSPDPSPSVTPTPVPTTTPFPSGSPMPTTTPIPTPTPIFGASASPGVAIASLTFRARVISDSREVLPVIQGTFTAHPYNLVQLQQELIAKNKVEAKPVAPLQTDAKYRQEQKICNSAGCTTEQTVNTDAYREDFARYQNSILPEWEKRAYAGLDEAIRLAANGRESLTFSTDSNGEASLRLPLGTWYFSGRYSAGGSVVVWESIPFAIGSSTSSIELTR